MRGDVFRETTRRRRVRAASPGITAEGIGQDLGSLIGIYFKNPKKGALLGKIAGKGIDTLFGNDDEDERRYQMIAQARRDREDNLYG